jgi:hypothetical protein
MCRALHSETVSAALLIGPAIHRRAEADTKTKTSPEMAVQRATAASFFLIVSPLGFQEFSNALAGHGSDDLKGHGPAAVAVLPNLVDGGLRGATGDDAARFIQAQTPLASDKLRGSGRPAETAIGRQSVPDARVKP